MTTNYDRQVKLQNMGFGQGRSAWMVGKAGESLIQKICDFADKAKEKGWEFRVFQSSGRNSYYVRLRLMLITGKKPNRYTDSRGWEGKIEEMEVGSKGITHAQLADIEDAVDALAAKLAA